MAGKDNYFNFLDSGELAAMQNVQNNPILAGNLQMQETIAPEVTTPSQGIDWGGWAGNFGNVAKGIGGLAQAWQGMQGLKLAKKQLAQQNEQWEKNYQAQRDDIAHDRARRSQSRSLMYS